MSAVEVAGSLDAVELFDSDAAGVSAAFFFVLEEELRLRV